MQYTNQNIPWTYLNTNTSDYQQGAVIVKHDMYVAYSSCKLSSPHFRYTAFEKSTALIDDTMERNLSHGISYNFCVQYSTLCVLAQNTIVVFVQ